MSGARAVVEVVPVAALAVDLARFQVRRSAHAESVAAAIERGGWKAEKAGVMHVWPDPLGEGRYYVMDGHSRLAGIARLPEDERPREVRAIVHRVSEAEAVALAQELNASARPLTKTELAQAWRRAIEREIAEGGEWEAVLARVAARFAGSTPAEIERDVTLAWLGTFAAEVVDSGAVPVAVGRELGRFLRSTKLEPQRGDEIMRRFIQSGLTPKEFALYLREQECSRVEAKQTDMFGERVVTEFKSRARAILEYRTAKEGLRMAEGRIEVLLWLDEQPGLGLTDAQREQLERDEAAIDELRERLRARFDRLKRLKRWEGAA